MTGERPSSRRSPRRVGASPYLDRPTLVRAAADLADTEGWQKLTLSLVAGRVHRHVTSLYAHVDSLDELRRQVALLATDELSEQVWKAALGRVGVDALRAIRDVYRAFALDHPGRTAAMLDADHHHDPELRAKGVRLAEPIYATFRSFGLSEAQVLDAHRIFSSAVRGLTIAESSEIFVAAGSLNSTFDQLIDLFVTAIGTGQWPSVAPHAVEGVLPGGAPRGRR